MNKRRIEFRQHQSPDLKAFAFCLSLGFGSRDDPEGYGGMAHLLEHCLMTAPTSNGKSLLETIEHLGGRANAETGLEALLIYAQVLPQDVEHALPALLNAALSPTFSDDAVRSEERVVEQELEAAQADASDIVQDMFLASLYPGHPLGRPVGGTPAELRRVDATALFQHHQLMTGQGVLRLSIVGPYNVDVARLLPEIEFVPFGQPTPRARQNSPLEPVSQTVHELEPDSSGYTWMCIGGRSSGRSKPSEPFTILAQLMGGSPSSLLYRDIRDNAAVAYMFDAWNRSYRETGAWRVLAASDASNLSLIYDVIVRNLELIRTGSISAEDRATAIRQAQMSSILGVESALDLAKLLVTLADPYLSRTDPIEAMLTALSEVSLQDLADSAQMVLEDLSVVVRKVGA